MSRVAGSKRIVHGLIVEAKLPRCTKCGKEFEDFEDTEGRRETVCISCAPNRGTRSTADAWQYTRKGVGFRLIAGFNLLNACERSK